MHQSVECGGKGGKGGRGGQFNISIHHPSGADGLKRVSIATFMFNFSFYLFNRAQMMGDGGGG